MKDLGNADREAITESYRIVNRAFHDAELAVRKRGDGAIIEVLRAQALANELIDVLRKHLGLIA